MPLHSDSHPSLQLCEVPDLVAAAAADREGMRAAVRALVEPRAEDGDPVRSARRHLLNGVLHLYQDEPWWWWHRGRITALDGMEFEAAASLVLALRCGGAEEETPPEVRAAMAGLGFDAWVRGLAPVPSEEPLRELLDVLAGETANVAAPFEALDRWTGHPCRSLLARVHRSAGDLHAGKGRIAEAWNHWLVSLQLKKDPFFAMELAERALDRGHVELSVELLETAETGGVYRETRLLWAEAARLSGKRDSAFAIFERALDTAPAPRTLNLQEVLLEIRRRVQAICGRDPQRWKCLASLRKAAAVERPNPARRGESLHRLRLRGALRAREAGLHQAELRLLEPLLRQRNLPAAWIPSLLAGLVRCERTAEAAGLIAGLPAAQRSLPEVAALNGWIHLAHGRFADARRIFGEGVRLRGAGPLVILGCSLVCAYDGKWDAAASLLDRLQEGFRELPAVLDLRAALLEMAGRGEDALPVRRMSFRAQPTPFRGHAFGRLAVARAVADPAGCAELLEEAVLALEGCKNPEAVALKVLALLKLGRDPPEEAFPVAGPASGEATVEVNTVLRAVVLELIRRNLLRGRAEEAADLIATVPGPLVASIRAPVLLLACGRKIERALAAGAAPDELETLRGEILALEDGSPLARAMLELLGALGAGACGPLASEEEWDCLPAGLRVATAQALLSRGRDLDRVRMLLEGGVRDGAPGRPESRVLLALLEPDSAEPAVESDLGRCREGAFPWLPPAAARGMDLRVLLLRGKESKIAAAALAEGEHSLVRRAAALYHCRAFLRLLSGVPAAGEVESASRLLDGRLPPDSRLASGIREAASEVVRELEHAASRRLAPASGEDVRERMDEARRLVDGGFLEDAEFVLGAAFVAAKRLEEGEVSREALELLLAVRSRRRHLREAMRVRTCEAWLSERRVQRLLEATGGKSPDPMLGLELRQYRVLGLYIAGEVDAAEAEHSHFLRWAALEGVPPERLWSARDSRLLARGLVRHGQEWLDLILLFRRGACEELVQRVRALADSETREPLAPWFLGRAEAARGHLDLAAAAAELAAHRALAAGDEDAMRAARADLARYRCFVYSGESANPDPAEERP